MNEDTDHFSVPEFKPSIPPELLKGKSDSERWMYEQTDLQRQQNDWIIKRLMHMGGWWHDVRFARTLRMLFGGVRGACTGLFALTAAAVLAELLIHWLDLK